MEFEILKDEDSGEYKLVITGRLEDSFWLDTYLPLKRVQSLADGECGDDFCTFLSCLRWIFEGRNVLTTGESSIEDQIHNLRVDIKEIREQLKCLLTTN